MNLIDKLSLVIIIIIIIVNINIIFIITSAKEVNNSESYEQFL